MIGFVRDTWRAVLVVVVAVLHRLDLGHDSERLAVASTSIRLHDPHLAPPWFATARGRRRAGPPPIAGPVA